MSDFSTPKDHRGRRAHRFMESSDINAAFDLLYRAMRRQVQRGQHVQGQFFALEADAGAPGRMKASLHLAPAELGRAPAAGWGDPRHRRALFDRLLRRRGAVALYAYACEERTDHDVPVVHVELAEADGWHAASYPLCTGRGWQERDLLGALHRRLSRAALD